MRKLVLRLVIACSTFSAGIFLTNVWNSLARADGQTIQIPVADYARAVSPAETELLSIYRDYGGAQTRHDSAFFERVEADNFILFRPDGTSLSRTEDIDFLNSFPTDITYQDEDLNIKIYGDAAIVTGRMTANYSGGFSHSWRWIDVCVRHGGRWRIQSTTQLD
jgi:hypothetical protein